MSKPPSSSSLNNLQRADRKSLKQKALKSNRSSAILESVLGAGGRAFKSPRPDQNINKNRLFVGASAFYTFALLMPAVLTAQGRLEGRGTAKRYISRKYEFSMAVPPGWPVYLAGDTPMYFSFSPSEDSFRQLRLPKGGAVISVIAEESLPGRRYGQSLYDWVAEDSRGASAAIPSAGPFEMPPETGGTTAIISAYDSVTFGPDDQSEHRVGVFWEFRGKRFVAHFSCPAHDPKGPAFEKIFLSTVRSIRPLDNARKR